MHSTSHHNRAAASHSSVRARELRALAESLAPSRSTLAHLAPRGIAYIVHDRQIRVLRSQPFIITALAEKLARQVGKVREAKLIRNYRCGDIVRQCETPNLILRKYSCHASSGPFQQRADTVLKTIEELDYHDCCSAQPVRRDRGSVVLPDNTVNLGRYMQTTKVRGSRPGCTEKYLQSITYLE